jgi:iron complex outermembrane receptor protein
MKSSRTYAVLKAGAAALAVTTALTSVTAFAQSATPDEGAADEQVIVVTGSLLRRTDTETPSPVTILTQDTLLRAGLTNVNDAIRSVSADGAGSISTGFQNGFSGGGAAVSLRGLGVSSTLVMIDGLRSANFPLNDDGHNAYVDLNSIPFSLIDRVEVLKDGASSTYGADAIGGVVNLILKKHVTGVDGTVEGGVTQKGDAGHQRFALTAGYGDYEDKGFNVFVSGEYSHDSGIQSRGFPFNSSDLSAIGGKDNNAADSSITTQSGSAIVIRAGQSNLNNPLSGSAAPLGTTYQLVNPATCTTGFFTAAQGTGCKHDLMKEWSTILPDQKRYAVSGRLSLRVADTIEAYVSGVWSHSEIYNIGRGGGSSGSNPGPNVIRATQPFGGSPSLASSNPGIVLPVYICAAGVNCATSTDRRLNPNNPFATAFANDPANGAARIYYQFADIPFNFTRKNDLYRVNAGLSGTIADSWNFRVEGVYARDNFSITDRGYINIANLLKAINTGSYSFANPASNSTEVRQFVSPDRTTPSHSTLASVDASISHDVAELPGGPLQVLVGGQIRRETLENNSRNADLSYYTLTTSAAFGAHTVSAAFFEIDAPILEQLDVNASGRYDHYSEGFSHFSPKVGVKFTPIKEIALRGTFSKGFRAPTFGESGPRSSFAGCSTYTPPAAFTAAHGGSSNGYANAYSACTGITGNPNLKPELSRSFTAGAVFQPTRWFSLTVDYYNVKKTDVIVQGPLGGDARNAYYRGATAAQGCANVAAIGAGYSCNVVDAVDPLFPNALPRVLIINAPFVNAGSQITSGMDITATLSLPLSDSVKFTSRLEVTDVFKFDLDPGDGAPIQKFVGTMGPYELSSGAGTPKWRGNWQNSLEVGKFTATLTAYYVSKIQQVAADEGEGDVPGLTCADDNLYGTGESFCYAKRFIDLDLNASVKVTDNFTFYANISNLLNAKAPVVPASYSGINYLPTWHINGVIGRAFRAGANFKF